RIQKGSADTLVPLIVLILHLSPRTVFDPKPAVSVTHRDFGSRSSNPAPMALLQLSSSSLPSSGASGTAFAALLRFALATLPSCCSAFTPAMICLRAASASLASFGPHGSTGMGP